MKRPAHKRGPGRVDIERGPGATDNTLSVTWNEQGVTQVQCTDASTETAAEAVLDALETTLAPFEKPQPHEGGRDHASAAAAAIGAIARIESGGPRWTHAPLRATIHFTRSMRLEGGQLGTLTLLSGPPHTYAANVRSREGRSRVEGKTLVIGAHETIVVEATTLAAITEIEAEAGPNPAFEVDIDPASPRAAPSRREALQRLRALERRLLAIEELVEEMRTTLTHGTKEQP